MALKGGHVQVAQELGAALPTPEAALSGSQTKAPGFAGEYLVPAREPLFLKKMPAQF